MKLWEYIRQALIRAPSQRIGENGVTLTYRDMLAEAERFAKRLSGEKSCAIYCRSEMAASLALLGCFAAGVTAVPLSVRYGEVHCRKIIDSISPTCVVTDSRGSLQIHRQPAARYRPPEEPPVLIMCTSGTTGKPKGAMLSDRNVLTNLRDIGDYFAMDEKDTILIARPLYHCAVLTGEFLTALTKGAQIRFYSENFNPAALLEVLETYRITVFCATPTLLNLLARFMRNSHQTGLRRIAVSGECMSEAVGRNIRKAFPEAEIYHVYGMTEASPRISYLPPADFDQAPDCVGIPLKSIRVKILGRDGAEAKEGEPGILWIQGDNVMQGYYEEPALTGRVIRDGWLCTGDIACRNARGFLKIKGRSDDMIIRAGMNIYPQEIEAALKKDPRTKEVLVRGVNDEKKGTQIAMKMVGEYRDADEVKALCMQLLPAFQVPTIIELTEELPRNGSGKIIRGE